MDIESNSIYEGEERDEQREQQWQDCMDDEPAKKRGFKNKEDYKKSLARVAAKMKELEDTNKKVNFLKEFLGEQK